MLVIQRAIRTGAEYALMLRVARNWRQCRTLDSNERSLVHARFSPRRAQSGLLLW